MYFPMLGFFDSEMIDATKRAHTAGANVKGKWVPGALTDSPIRIAELQPVKSSELNKLEDGEHVHNFMKTYTEDMTLRTKQGNTSADLLVVYGKTYEVFAITPRPQGELQRIIIKEVG